MVNFVTSKIILVWYVLVGCLDCNSFLWSAWKGMDKANDKVGKATGCSAGNIHWQRCHTRGESRGKYITYSSAKV